MVFFKFKIENLPSATYNVQLANLIFMNYIQGMNNTYIGRLSGDRNLKSEIVLQNVIHVYTSVFLTYGTGGIVWDVFAFLHIADYNVYRGNSKDRKTKFDCI